MKQVSVSELLKSFDVHAVDFRAGYRQLLEAMGNEILADVVINKTLTDMEEVFESWSRNREDRGEIPYKRHRRFQVRYKEKQHERNKSSLEECNGSSASIF